MTNKSNHQKQNRNKVPWKYMRSMLSLQMWCLGGMTLTLGRPIPVGDPRNPQNTEFQFGRYHPKESWSTLYKNNRHNWNLLTSVEAPLAILPDLVYDFVFFVDSEGAPPRPPRPPIYMRGLPSLPPHPPHFKLGSSHRIYRLSNRNLIK